MQKLCFLLLSLVSAVFFLAADWPMYQNNAARTGSAETETLSAEMKPLWSFTLPVAPEPAWPRSDRMAFDRAVQVAVAQGKVVFGNSGDGIVYALNAATGKLAWQFFTEGPVRFAPAVWQEQVFVASDDGFLYALGLADGKLLWKKRGGPDERLILGNQRLVSKWPARGGPLVVDDTVYFAAGIWPSDGLHLYALNAATGDIIWHNDDSGDFYMPQPHGGADAASGVAAQGYLAASENYLFVPTGRAVPAVFNRSTGKFLYFHLQKNGHSGGATTLAAGRSFFNSGLYFDAATGEKQGQVGMGPLAANESQVVLAAGAKLHGYKMEEKASRDRRGAPVFLQAFTQAWSAPLPARAVSLVALKSQYVVGAQGRVDLIDPAVEKPLWSCQVPGEPLGLAVAEKRLFISTDMGKLFCFGTGESAESTEARDQNHGAVGRPARELAAEILEQSDQRQGYCVDLSCGDGSLALELARQSELLIYAVADNPPQVDLVRKNIQEAGLYGNRIVVHSREKYVTGYPRYFADLVVAGEMPTADGDALRAEAQRLQRPYGGVVCFGKAGSLEISRRGPLEGAGDWTHQYANPANSLNSGDVHLQGKLGMLWFRDFDWEVPQRHGRAPAPLSSGGRLFHAGLHGILAVDAYNGRELWRYEIKDLLTAYDGDELMGVSGTGSNFCLQGDSVFVRHGDRCLKLSAAEGKLLSEFAAPKLADGKPATWGFLACENGILYGSVADPEHVVTFRYIANRGDMKRQLTESKSLFAFDADSGELLWHYEANDSIRHNSIALGKGRVYFIDRPLAMFDRQKRPENKEHPLGKLVCLQAETGRQEWMQEEDIFGTMLALSTEHQTLLMSYQPTRFRLDSEIGGRLAAFRAETGEKLWEQKAAYSSRPMINGRSIVAEGGGWDLLTGESRPLNFKRSYGCGILAGARDMMLFRSATLGYFDFSDQKTLNYGGMRPGCWVNAIPAAGLVLVPDASAGCQCSYLNRCWIVLQAEAK